MSGRPLLIANINPSARTLDGCRQIAAAFEDLDPSLPIEIRHWETINPGLITRLEPLALIIGPNDTPFPAYPPRFDTFLSLVRARRRPTLGICGGHQALALAHGAPIGPVHAVPAATTSYAGMPKIEGPVKIRLVGDADPLLTGVPEEISVHASHVDEVKEVPPGFRVLAIGDPCNVQMIKADRRPLYGVQFHPERPVEIDGDDAGRRILANFLALARAR